MKNRSMRFFTRDAYQAMQESDNAAQSELRWNALAAEYAKHLAVITPSLAKSMQAFAGVSLHDGKVTSAQLGPDCVVVLEIEGSGFWGPRVAQHAELFESARARLARASPDACCIALPRIGPSRITLTFTGVEAVEGLGDIVGDWWLYDEVHMSDGSAFDYRVLMQDSEFRVVAKEVICVDHGCG
jgi:hypothetical protein